MADHRDKKLVAVVAALLTGAAAVVRPLPVHAQFGGACGVTPFDPCFVSDQSAEASLADTDTIQLPGIFQQETTTATSLTTPGGGGVYTPNAALISALDQQLFAQVNSQNASTLFPGFQPLPSSTLPTLRAIATGTLQTYAAALATAQSQDAELRGENFARIGNTSAGTTYALTAIQANTEAALQVASELQYVRQLLITLIEIEATKASEEMNERAQDAATTATHFNEGALP